jgi:AcrR family transcriptional regulator/NAD(P)-dependent dehydrogenase (short-subunit alcohol dehydrogenase family)
MAEIPAKVKSKKLVKERREQIVLAAIKLFSQKGFHKTTLRELAEEAGISHGSIYEYVTNKEDIFFLVYEFMHGVAQKIIDQSIGGVEDPVEKLRRLVKGEFDIMHNWADAILLIYQETHVLGKPLLYKLLEQERRHVGRIESVLEECIQARRIRECNVRVTANLIRALVETWVVKRWDLRNHVNRLEMEKAILDLVHHGLNGTSGAFRGTGETPAPYQGKIALVINSATPLGNAISTFILSRGARLIAYQKKKPQSAERSILKSKNAGNLKTFTADAHGPMTGALFKKIVSEAGSIDFVIQDLGIGLTRPPDSRQKSRLSSELAANLRSAEDVAAAVETEIPLKGSGPMVFLAPWGWDRFADPLRYDMVKQATAWLTQATAVRLAKAKINVNGIIPGFISSIKPSAIERQEAPFLLEQIPLGTLGEVSDVLEAIRFLISDSARYLTGQVLHVAGGMRE